jgi:hypothetical protein
MRSEARSRRCRRHRTNTSAIKTAAFAAYLAMCSVLWAGCEDSEKPDTFMDDCELDAGQTTCEKPFECLPAPREKNDPEPLPICTKVCKRTSDCPGWYNEEGHCAGDFQSVCLFGYCQGWCI